MAMSDYTTAIHEAAHAVIGRVLGLPCGAVSVRGSEDGKELGHAVVVDPVRVWRRGDGARRPMVEASCACLYAGAEAERVILGLEATGDESDRDRATSLIRIVGVRGASGVQDDAWHRYEAKLRGRAAAFVAKHRATIERVAASLLARGSLSGREVNAIMAQA
jgi:hypothetical protein